MAPQDSFIDEDDDCCPLCVEEFDLSDKNFRPCPCGYQVCQFCFNNIKNNINGLCPACRRPYDEKTIEWKVVTPEEIAQFKANIQKNAKKKAEQRQKEAQKREVESLNRKHLSGLRVVQKNLVYVVGLSPAIREEDILQTLRGDKYFGQYGKIIKIVVSKAKQGDSSQNAQSLGVYVTFARKEDAARCIAAVNGSHNGDRVLRAQLGTTKYCSAYLRNEVCTNKQCMFLHEPGDNDDSYSRQDLSSINSVNTQRPLAAMGSSSASSSRQAAQAQAPIPQAQPVAAAAQPMARGDSNPGSDSGDGSALPSSANWGNRGIQQRSRRGSHATSGAASSPAVSQALPATAEAAEEVSEPVEELAVEESIPDPISDATSATDMSRTERDPILRNLMRAINSSGLSFTGPEVTDDEILSFPPLFDENGGDKRRAMRVHQEEARLHVEHESQGELRNVPEPIEEEEPESGSLQLGGEPEDRDIGHENGIQQGFQRRTSTQLPIQRGSNGAPYGGGLGQSFPQNLSNLSSINGRTLTPLQQQQLLLMKSAQPQSSFMDQFPPGMGSQLGQASNLFQQQGHNRQSSRYSFANDSSSGANVKPSANPKLMAQQSSMMPSGSQFYGSSMPGPPPGLKSSGTPPIGGMFGQAHSFGGSIGAGSAFAGVQKENNNDVLRDMLRGRGAVNGNQPHDTGKREYMFPSFLHQYPSASSTPAPASGLLASLYGPQTGAFHDFGQKQKKKGKKHRHANTSSSGGGGLVDLADPSILQARMQHRQQSNAGVGQVFSGQGQDDEAPLDEEAATSVDALVADSFPDDFSSQNLESIGFGSRSSTPTVPPGFETTHGHPNSSTQEGSAAKLPSKMIATSAEFTPSKPRASTPLVQVALPSSPNQNLSRTQTGISTMQAKHDVKTLATSSGLSKAIASQTVQSNLRPEEFPALDSPSFKPISSPSLTRVVKAETTAARKTATQSGSTVNSSKSGDKKATPGVLNITAKSAGKVSAPSPVEASSTSVVPSFEFPPLKAAPAASQLPRNTPKTLRIAPAAKTEVPTTPGATPNATPLSGVSPFPQVANSSRQASLASTTRMERPGTPTSEIISDNASLTSTSLSRANSPPPMRIGSAPVRDLTKSMTKKTRIQRKKNEEAALPTASRVEPDVVEVAPILGRKKKQKKGFITGTTATSTPSPSRAPSPAPLERVSSEQKTIREETEGNHQMPEPQPQTAPEAVKSVPKAAEPKDRGKAKAQQNNTLDLASTTLELEDEVIEKPTLSPATILQELVDSGILPSIDNLNLLKGPNISLKTADLPVDLHGASQKLSITAEDRAALLAGHPVHKVAEGPNRIMLTPNGDCVRNLTEEEEQRYLELQSRIAEDAGSPTVFTSSKYHTGNGFTLIGGRAVPNGPPAFFPTAATGTSFMDPVSKIQRDEALSYINQYVLPSLSTNSQLEKALNAKALDTDLLRSSDASNWAAWGNDVAAAHAEHGGPAYHGAPSNDGMLGLESMTAHFTVGGNMGQPLGNVSMLGLAESESALQLARKEVEGFEKKLNALVKKNRKLLLPSQH